MTQSTKNFEINLSYKVQNSFIFVFILLFALFATQSSHFLPYLIPALFLLFLIHYKATSPPFSLDNLSVQRRLSRDRIIEGKNIEITLIVKNNSHSKSELIEIIDHFPEKFNIFNSLNKFLISLDPHEVLEMTYTCICDHIGVFEFDSVSMIHKDFLNVTTQTKTVSQKEMKDIKREVIVIPKIEKIETLPVAEQWLQFYNGNFKSQNIGLDADFRSVRKFQYGDSLRSINWKKTARYQLDDNLYSNSFNLDKAISAEIVLDSTFSAGSIWIESLRQAMTIAEFLLRNRNEVGLTILTKYPDYIPPKFGKRHLKKMLDLLMRVDIEARQAEEMIIQRLKVIMRKYNQNSAIIIISPFMNEHIFEFATFLKKHNFKVMAITPMALLSQISTMNDEKIIEKYIVAPPIVKKLTELDLRIQQEIIDVRLRSQKIFQIKWYSPQPLETTFKYVRITY